MASKRVEVEIVATDKTGRATKSAEKNFARIGKAAAAAAPLITAAFGTALVKAVFTTTASFQKLDAMLVTATGSAQAASEAFMNLQEFAETTPFQLDEVVDAFIKMKNLGLDPTNEALTSFGNTAVAMGKDLNQMIEAVADAATGEFERLKEFGIKARSEGENVSFTFQGVTTTVKKNAEDITGFLEGLGTNNFSGAMVKQMDTINGAVSNLQDNLSKLFNLNTENANVITNWLQDASFLVAELNRAISDTPFAEKLGEANLEIFKMEQAIKAAREEAAKGGGFFDSVFGIDPDSPISNINIMIAQLEELKRRRDAIQAEAPAEGAVTDTRATQNQETLAVIEEQENGAFLLREARRMAELEDFRLIQEGMEEATLTRLMNERQVGLETEEALRASRQTTANLSVNLLSFLGQKNRGFALAALALQKGLDISKIISASAVAQTTALALPPGLAAAKIAQIKAFTAANIALVAGLGLAQAAGGAGGGGSVGGGGGGAAPIAQPQPTAAEPVGGTTLIFEGDFIDERLIEEKIIPLFNQATGRGVTLEIR